MLRDNAIREETGCVSRGKGVLVGESRAAVMGGMDETTTMNDTETKKRVGDNAVYTTDLVEGGGRVLDHRFDGSCAGRRC